MTSTHGVEVTGLWKTYGTSPVIKGVDLHFRAGEVHALLGPNGAGKSTVLGCLSGAVHPDSGSICVGGISHAGFTPGSAMAAGTAIIYQHFQLVADLTVAENVFLGQELRTRTGQVAVADQNAQSRKLISDLGLKLDVAQPVSRLSVGEQQIVAIARALRHQPTTLILDEPTAALSKVEVEILLNLVRRLAREQRMTIIYVTHLLREVLDVADRVTMLRDGSVLWTKGIDEVDLDTLVQGIAPHPVDGGECGRRPDRGPVLLSLTDFESSHTGPVTLDIHEGEIVALFGLLGSGRTDLLEGLAGVRHSRGGRVGLRDHRITLGNPRRVHEQGIALVPADRKQQALFGDLPAIENVLMPNYSRFSHWWRRKSTERKVFARVASQVRLVPPKPQMPANDFSGGNAQKLAVGRWLTGLDSISVLLLDEPTQGVDVGARQDIYGLLRAYVESAPRGILIASNDAEEVVALADRVVVLVAGRPVAIVRTDVGETALISMAHGVTDGLTEGVVTRK